MKYTNPSPETQAHNSQKLRLRQGCPLSRTDFDHARKIRGATLANGYDRVVATSTPWNSRVAEKSAGKKPIVEYYDPIDGVPIPEGYVPATASGGTPLLNDNGKPRRYERPWTMGHTDLRLGKVSAWSANTGLVLGGPHKLIAIDLDPQVKKAAGRINQTRAALSVAASYLAERAPGMFERMLKRKRDPGSVVLLFRTNEPETFSMLTGEVMRVDVLAEGRHVVIDGRSPR